MHDTGRILIRLSWLCLLGWQIIWHALAPLLPAGNHNWAVAAIALLPLLPFTPGVLKLRQRTLIYGMFIVMIYFIIGIMETWANPEQRSVAVVQVVLSCLYFVGLVLFNRPRRSQPD